MYLNKCRAKIANLYTNDTCLLAEFKDHLRFACLLFFLGQPFATAPSTYEVERWVVNVLRGDVYKSLYGHRSHFFPVLGINLHAFSFPAIHTINFAHVFQCTDWSISTKWWT